MHTVHGKKFVTVFFSGNDAGSFDIDNNAITFENKNQPLATVLDSKLFFEDHINYLCKKASQKLDASTRIALCICPVKKTVIKTFVTSQFGSVL